jgi:OOP family OmpA-OmpF porin
MKTKSLTLALFIFFSASTIYALSTNPPADKAKKDYNVNKAILIAELTKNIEYDNAKSSIRQKYNFNLNRLAKLVIDDNYVVSLRGHADSIGKYKPNWILSDYRAIAVKKYLIKKGVKEDRIVSTPFGSTVPIASNKTSTGRQKNRRVEIELKEIGK